MRNLGFLILTILFITSTATIVNTQPRLSVWRVEADHQDNHEHTLEADEKIQYDCGVYYYMSHTGEQIDMHIALRNDGTEDLQIESPIKMSVLSSKFLEVTSDASSNTLAPGEETMITISYLNTGDYVPGQRGVITFKSNDFINPFCGFSIEIGGPPPPMPPSYCVCENGDTLTLTEMIDGGPGDQDGFIIPIQPNQFKLHFGPCTDDDECPEEESLSCYYTNFLPNFRTAIAGNQAEAMAPSAAPVYLELSSGYCPCIIETDFCIERTDDLPSLVEDECVGDPRTYEVYNCWEDDFVQDHGDLTLPEGYNYEWCTDGGGIFSNNMGLDASIAGWFPQDILFVKVTNEEGCIGVTSIFLNGGNGYSLPIRLQNEPPVCMQDDLVLCLEVDPVLKRDAINTRSDNVIWSTNGDGVFSYAPSEPGQHCITISGMKFGDKVYAVDHASHDMAQALPEGCPPYGVYNSTFDGPYPCTEAFENRGLGGISLDDPCNCADPLNNPPPGQGITEFFHDVLTIENLNPFEAVTITPLNNFRANNGEEIMFPFGRSADMWGRIEVDFWHAPGIPATADIVPSDSDPTSFTSSICEPCIPIPTLGQWGIIILGMMIFIIGIVFMRQGVTKRNLT